MSTLVREEPIDIIMVTYQRPHLLEGAVKRIYNSTCLPYRLWVVNNGGDDKTAHVLKRLKLHGYVHDYILAEKNGGQAYGQNLGLEKVTSEYVITTQDDLLTPEIAPCWLKQMVHLAEKHKDTHCAISMRIQRIRHRDVDETKDLIESPTSLASVFRIQRTEDVRAVGGFGKRPHWESTEFVRRMAPHNKRYAVATHIYADHTGFMPSNKGFEEGKEDYHTYSKERVNQGNDQPYPDTDPRTNTPIRINTLRDRHEQSKREEHWKYWGSDMRRKPGKPIPEHTLLAKYVKGNTLEVGCGSTKIHPDTIGMDIYPGPNVNVVGDIRDLWFVEDNSIDAIVSSHSLEHLPDTKAALAEWKRVVKPGGIIAVAVPNGELRPGSIKGSHKVVLTKEVLRVIFKFCLGMRVVKILDVPDKQKGKEVIMVVAQKRK